MFQNLFSDEELQQGKRDWERAAGVHHHLSRSQAEPKCHCGRRAAQDPGLSDWLFRRAKAKVQKLAAQAHKCTGCYEIDNYVATVTPKRSAP